MSDFGTALFGNAFVLFWLVGIVLAVFVGALFPLMAWSVTRNVKGIRLELERLNRNLEGSTLLGAALMPGPVREFSAGDVAAGFHTRTGPLGIR